MNGEPGPGRQLRLHVLRHNPRDPASVPRLQTFELTESDGMTLFVALNEIRATLDPSLQFDFVCRAGICGSCGMLINGRPGLACRTLTRGLGPDITLAPLPVFELIGDLSVNTGKWMRALAERLGAVDRQDARKMHSTPTPRLGGVAVLAGLIGGCVACGLMRGAGTLAWLFATKGRTAVLVAGAIVFGVES